MRKIGFDMFSKVRFLKTSGRFIFQGDDRFYVAKIERLINELKIKGLLGQKSEVEIIESEISKQEKEENELSLDIRLVGSETTDWVSAVMEGKILTNEIGENLINGRGETYVVSDSWSNPQIVHKDILRNLTPYVSPSSRVLPGAMIVGNSYIGEGCVIGNNALVRNSYIDDGAVVGYNTEVSASYIGRRTTLHTNFVGNSIIGDDCHLGYIACTTTLRLDGENVMIERSGKKFDAGKKKIGSFMEINCSLGAYVVLMPGSFIGKGSIIMPYTSIKGFVPRNSYCRSVVKTKVESLAQEKDAKKWYVDLNKKLKEELNNNYNSD